MAFCTLPSLDVVLSCLYAAIAVFVVRFFGLVVYNIYSHPLRHFPGPKFAAACYLPEFYHDVVQGGMYIWQINNMHERYGAIIDALRNKKY